MKTGFNADCHLMKTILLASQNYRFYLITLLNDDDMSNRLPHYINYMILLAALGMSYQHSTY